MSAYRTGHKTPPQGRPVSTKGQIRDMVMISSVDHNAPGPPTCHLLGVYASALGSTTQPRPESAPKPVVLVGTDLGVD
ncbi:MAG: hypothetical protein O6853_05415, partial [Actinobacteria bacterium]|nr:hypothetical protein [Actinomycetota bacterium]